MSAPARLAAFFVVVVALALAGFGVGRAVGPTGEAPPTSVSTPAHDMPGMDMTSSGAGR